MAAHPNNAVTLAWRLALGTVEVRVMDALSGVREVAPLVALIQSLARLELEGETQPPTSGTEVLADNRVLATRNGTNARLIDPVTRTLIPVRATLHALPAECPHALALGCARALDRARWLAAAPGGDRQRALAAGPGGLEHLVAWLAERLLARDRLAATAGSST